MVQPRSEASPELGLPNFTDQTIESVSSEADAKTVEEQEDLDRALRRAQTKGVLQDIDERKKYARCIFYLVVGWLALMAYILLAQGYNTKYFLLSDRVLIAVVTTTTGGVVGLLLVVVKYLFPAKP